MYPLRCSLRVPIWAALALIALTVVGCGEPRSVAVAPTSPPKPLKVSNTLRWWNNYGAQWVRTLDPALITDPISGNNVALIHANLVKLDYPGTRVKPDLATWSVSRSRKTYTFHIRQAARFSNGDRVTAGDAAWSLTRSLLPTTKSAVALIYLGHIAGARALAAGRTKSLKGVKVVDSQTLRIDLDKPVPYFLTALSYPPGDVLDRKVLQGKAVDTYVTNTCSANIGAGPFRLICRNGASGSTSFYPADQAPYMQYEPNPRYYGKRPRIHIFAPYYNSLADTFAAFRRGRLDGTIVDPTDVIQARKLPGFSTQPARITEYLTPNEQIPPFDNRHCRLAVAYAIDRERIAGAVQHGTTEAMYSVVPPDVPGGFVNPVDVPHHVPARARRELARCPGGLDGVTLTFFNHTAATAREYAAIRSDLVALGADIKIKPLAEQGWLNVVTRNMNETRGQERITHNVWSADYPDPQDWCDNLLRSRSVLNIGGFASRAYDRLISRANVEPQPSRRAQLYRQAQRIALKDGAIIPIEYQKLLAIVSPKIKGMTLTANQIQPIHNDWSRVSISH